MSCDPNGARTAPRETLQRILCLPPAETSSHSSAPPVALVSGITGQDGGYLAKLLLKAGYEVHGFARNVTRFDCSRLGGASDEAYRLHLHTCDIRDSDGILRLLEAVDPNEIYNLAGQTHIQASFEHPAYTADVNATGTVRLLTALVELGLAPQVRFCQASSSEMFGDVGELPQTEGGPFHPLNPYAVSKHAAFETTINFREAFGVFAANAIMFNHESPYRGESFVTRKISRAVAAFHRGEGVPLRLGNIDSRRDWGHAQDYMEGMWLMLQRETPTDYVFASGENHSVREFVECAFAVADRRVAWSGSGVEEIGRDAASGEQLVVIDPAFFRPTDIGATLGDPSKARKELGWKPGTSFAQLVHEMVTADIARGLKVPAG